MYVDCGTNTVHDGTNLNIEIDVYITDFSALKVLLSKYSSFANCEFMITQNTLGQIVFYLRDTNNTTETASPTTKLTSGVWNNIKINVVGNNVTFTINDVTETITYSTLDGTINTTTIPLKIGAYGSGSAIFDGKMSSLTINEAIDLTFSEGNLNTLYNRQDETNNATIINFDLTFWDSTQDLYHYNYTNGFDLYENGNDGEAIRVPIGATVSQSGYTLTASYPATIGLNNCETSIKISGSASDSILLVNADLSIANGNYTDEGNTFNSKTIWENLDTGYKIWVYSGGNTWFCSASTGNYANAYKVLASDASDSNKPAPSSQLAWVSHSATLPVPTVASQTGVVGLDGYQEDNLIASITDNKNLEWVDGELRGGVILESGTSTVTDNALGTRLYAPDGNNCYFRFFKDFEIGKVYNYYYESTIVSGRIAIGAGGITKYITATGSGTSSFTATSDSNNILFSRYSVGNDAYLKKFVIWEDGTIPPLSYSEMETNFNNNKEVYSCINKGKSILFYNPALSVANHNKLIKCFAKKGCLTLLKSLDDPALYDLDGYILTSEA